MIRLCRLYAHNFKQLQEIELFFPDAARILVEGKNEAGKSTLFEAVFFALFGNGLATESGTRSLDGLIAYGSEKARVELDVACGDRTFCIARTIVRDKANVWELDVLRMDNQREEIRGNAAVNKRLIAELGFDGEALLNTCFVEQKKLEKLEGLGKSKREESLAKLLNLDAIVELENNLKVRGEDRQEWERLKKRAELADIQAELPTCESELQGVESRLHLIELERAVSGAVQEMRAIRQLDGIICELAAQRDSLNARAERVDALKEAMLHIKEARDAIERIAEHQAEIDRCERELVGVRDAIQEGNSLGGRSAALKRLARQLARLDQIRQVHLASAAKASDLTGMQTRLVELAKTVAREEETLASLEALLVQCATAEALAKWIAAKESIASPDSIEKPVKEQQAARDRLSQRFRTQIFGLAALLLVFVLSAILIQPLMLLFSALATVALIAMAARITTLWRELARAAETLGRTQGEARARTVQNQERQAEVGSIETQFVQLNNPIPKTIEEAKARRQEIMYSLDTRTESDLRAEQTACRERLLNARAVLGELEQQHGVQDALRVHEEAERLSRRSAKASAILGRWRERLQVTAQSLVVEAKADAIQRMLFQIDAQVEQIQQRVTYSVQLEETLTQRKGQVQVLAARAQQALEHARDLALGSPTWAGLPTAKDCTAFGKALRAEYDELGGDAVVKQAREIEGELGRRQGERESRARNAAMLVTQTLELLKEIGRAEELASPPSLEEWEELRGKFQTANLGEEGTLRLQQRDLVGRLHSLRDRGVQLERELGITDLLDPVACRKEFEEKGRQLLVRERGVEIVSLARRRIVSKVLPATMDYMRLILPTLTRDRYHDARLDPESYKIQVWDERAANGGAYKEKNIFSGGTKDQFSLALRLAFALATLPQERGSAPSFIFLDEPLGSFDQERAEALVYLLTEGEIARAFDQIFLISHVHVDERLFSHRVILENGRVSYSDLPSSAPAGA